MSQTRLAFNSKLFSSDSEMVKLLERYDLIFHRATNFVAIKPEETLRLLFIFEKSCQERRGEDISPQIVREKLRNSMLTDRLNNKISEITR